VGLDRFGLEMILPDELRMQNLVQLVEAGYANRVVMSQDYPLCLKGRMGPDLERLAPKWSITHIFRTILPRLKELGLGDKDIETILVSNPKSLFANAAAHARCAH
jgi:phosphotriesterase-related protein